MSGPKYHHRIPQTYMKPWCIEGNSVWVYDKKTGKSELRNIENIMGVKFYHSMKAGDLFTTKDALNNIFGCLDPFIVKVADDNGVEVILSDHELQNKHFDRFDNWVIEDQDGNIISKKQKNILHDNIVNSSDNTIEEMWSQKLENSWAETISEVKKNIHSLSFSSLETIFNYISMFKWRRTEGSGEARAAFEAIIDFFPEGFRSYSSTSPHIEDKTFIEDLWHAYLLQNYYNFLNGHGTIENEKNILLNNTTLIFAIDPNNRLITSDNPYIEVENENGEIEPIFVALPSLVIRIAKKDQNNQYYIKTLTSDEVEEYNQKIFDKGGKIISRKDISGLYQ